MNFRVELEIFRGPMDLLLYLVRKHEVEITEIPIAPITAQFLEYIDLLRQLDLNQIGDFVDMASTLLEIKSRMVLPHGGEEGEEMPDPREELAARLLEYKKYKDAASMLDERSRSWQEHFPRLSDDLPPRGRNLADEEIREVELWDLVSAFGRIMRDRQAAQPSNIVYDDTPIHVYMAQIQARLSGEERLTFQKLFHEGMHKSALVGVFLAVLELVRNYHVRTEQNELFGEIWIMPGDAAGAEIDPTLVDNYDRSSPKTQAVEEEADKPAKTPRKRAPRKKKEPGSVKATRKKGREPN
jgi:segregation and condensation protein A